MIDKINNLNKEINSNLIIQLMIILWLFFHTT